MAAAKPKKKPEKSPVGDPDCPHPKEFRRYLGYGSMCDRCERFIKGKKRS